MGRMANGWLGRTRMVVNAYPCRWARQPGYVTLDMVADPPLPRSKYALDSALYAPWDDGDSSVDERFDMPPLEQHWQVGDRITIFSPPTYYGVGTPNCRLVIRIGDHGPYLHLRFLLGTCQFILERATPAWALDEEFDEEREA